MEVITKMEDAIHHLLQKGTSREYLCINMSQLVFDTVFKTEIYSKYGDYMHRVESNVQDKILFSCVEINTKHPYHEIVIYDKILISRSDEFIVKLEIK